MFCRPLSHLVCTGNPTVSHQSPCLEGQSNRLFLHDFVGGILPEFQSLSLNSLRPTVLLCDSPDIFDDIRSGNVAAVRSWVVSRDANLRKVDSDSWTALHWAVEYGRSDLVLILLDSEPLLLHMKTKEGLSAINIAAWRGDVGMCKLLLEQGSDVNDRTQWGETPLHHAVSFGHLAVSQFLLASGADPNAMDKMERTPFKLAAQKGSKEMKLLFEKID